MKNSTYKKSTYSVGYRIYSKKEGTDVFAI